MVFGLLAGLMLLPYALYPWGVLATLVIFGFSQAVWYAAVRGFKPLRRMMLFGLTLTFALFFGELFARRQWSTTPYKLIATQSSGTKSLYRKDPLLGHVQEPNFSGRFQHPDYGNELFETNSEGFRGIEWPTSARGEEARVLLLGDSTTVGFGVSESETISHQLGKQLAWTLGDVVTFNTGIAGYGPRHELLVLQRLAQRLHPTHVVVTFYDGNDLQNSRDQFALEQAFTAQANLPKVQEPNPGPGRGPSLLSRAYWSHRSALYNRIETALLPWLSETGIFKHHALQDLFERCRFQATPTTLEEVDLAAEAVLAMAQLCEDMGAKFLFVRMPMRIQTEVPSFEQVIGVYVDNPSEHDRTLPGRTMLEFCAEHGIATLDLLPIFETTERGSNPHYYLEGHPNARGNRVAAQHIATRFLEIQRE